MHSVHIALMAQFFFETQMNYEGSTHPMSRLRKDAKKGAAKNRRPHANVLKTGRTQNANDRRQSTSAREDSQRSGSLAWTSEFNAPRTGMLRAMNFVMTPPAVSAPMSKRMRSRSRSRLVCHPCHPCMRTCVWSLELFSLRPSLSTSSCSSSSST